MLATRRWVASNSINSPLRRLLGTSGPLSRAQQQAAQQKVDGHESESTKPQQEEKRVSPHARFYREFAGPILKVLAFTFPTYYGMIYLWEYLEAEEQKETHSNLEQPVITPSTS